MSAQTISGFNGINYNQIIVKICRTCYDQSTISCYLWFPQKGISLWAGADNGATDCARKFTWNNDGTLTVDVDYFSGEYQPTYIIPLFIYGLQSKIIL